MENKIKSVVLIVFVFLGTGCVSTDERQFDANSVIKKPKLVLQITVDQLRGDMPTRYMKNMGEGGFRYLQEKGIWYANAHYGHSNTETVVGHTTLATGADPSEHGMISNVWFDRVTGKLVYNIEDKNYSILSPNANISKSNEVDPTQRMATADGRSPANILVSTFSDELALQSNGKAKIFAVSVKDRGAVTMAGQSGKAFWFSKKSGEFITSSYYYDAYPNWVNAWNQQKKSQKYANTAWSLLKDKSTYTFANSDDNAWEVDIDGFGRTFPHNYQSADGKYFNSLLTFSPAGDELTLDFAKAIVDNERLGEDNITDYLSISFSSTDYIGHFFGPSSLEAEDNMLRLDRTLANLFAYIDKKIGLENTLIILSADHGVAEASAFLQAKGIDAGYVSVDKLNKGPYFPALKKKFGVGKSLVRKYFPPHLYLDHKVIRNKGLSLVEVEHAVADELMKIDGIARVVSGSDLRNNSLPLSALNNAAIRNYHKQRSGDLLVLFKTNYYANDFGGKILAANHGSPWRYDTFVPIIFAGGHLQGRKITRRVEPKDVASTLAIITGTKIPSGSSGTVMFEIFNR